MSTATLLSAWRPTNSWRNVRLLNDRLKRRICTPSPSDCSVAPRQDRRGHCSHGILYFSTWLIPITLRWRDLASHLATSLDGVLLATQTHGPAVEQKYTAFQGAGSEAPLASRLDNSMRIVSAGKAGGTKRTNRSSKRVRATVGSAWIGTSDRPNGTGRPKIENRGAMRMPHIDSKSHIVKTFKA